MFNQSLAHVENLNLAMSIPDTDRFHWYTQTHSGFQALMHVISELRDPKFKSPDRLRALNALQAVKSLKMASTSKNWLVTRGMIDKTLLSSSWSVADQAIASPPLSISANQAVDIGSDHIYLSEPPVFRTAATNHPSQPLSTYAFDSMLPKQQADFIFPSSEVPQFNIELHPGTNLSDFQIDWVSYVQSIAL